MALLKAFLTASLSILLLLHSAYGSFEHQKQLTREFQDISTVQGRSLLATIDCSAACNVRCSLSSRPNLCKRACGTCCARCHCVPSGTSGNYQECPCYASQTTHGGRKKCP